MQYSETIGIIGGYGKFGSKLAKRLEQAYPQKQIIRAEDKSLNCEIARKAGVLVLAIPPEQIMSVVMQVKDLLSSDGEVVSFASGVPLKAISTLVPGHVAKAMMNQDATVGMVLTENRDMQINKLLTRILWHPLRYASSDREIDEFTVSLVYLYVVGLWAITQRADDKQNWLRSHLSFAVDELGLGEKVTHDLLVTVSANSDLRDQLEEKAARGGITASMVDVLKENDSTPPRELYTTGRKRMEEYIRQQAPAQPKRPP